MLAFLSLVYKVNIMKIPGQLYLKAVSFCIKLEISTRFFYAIFLLLTLLQLLRCTSFYQLLKLSDKLNILDTSKSHSVMTNH